MALVEELAKHGCRLAASPICKYCTGEVAKCAACEYSSMPSRKLEGVLVEWYQQQRLLEEYPFPFEEDRCGLCKTTPNPASTTAHAVITNKEMNVYKDRVGTDVDFNHGQLSVDVPCCEECKQRIQSMKTKHKIAIALGFLVGALLLIGINFSTPEMDTALRFCVFVMSVVLGFGTYLGVSKLFWSQASSLTTLDVFDLKPVNPIKDRRWFLVGKQPFIPSFTFEKGTKKKSR